MKNINSNIISSSSLRVPTDTVGVINVILFVKDSCSKEEILKLTKEYENNQQFKVLINCNEALVSSDFKSQNYTTILDHRFY